MANASFRGTAALMLAAAAAYGQGGGLPSFEVASVKLAQPMRATDAADLLRQYYGAVKIDPAQVRLTNQTLASLISTAYRVKAFQISAPDWIGSARYDIVAKIPDGVAIGSAPEMLQSLLQDRLKLQCHLASKEFDVFILSVREGGPKVSPKPADYKFSATAAAWPQTMESLANELTRGMGRPVMDKTGLPGEYMVPRDFGDLISKVSVRRYFPESADPDRAAETPATGDIRRSIQALGLRLSAGKQSLPLLVVEHAEKTPTEN